MDKFRDGKARWGMVSRETSCLTVKMSPDMGWDADEAVGKVVTAGYNGRR
jgi:hypothetical protein